MPIESGQQQNTVQATGVQIVSEAMVEIGALPLGEQPSGTEADYVIKKANDIFDQWSAQRSFAYGVQLLSFNLTPNKSPHTIGPNAPVDLKVAQRPVRIVNGNIILNNVTPNVRAPINTMRDAEWWAYVSVQGISTSIPTDLYFDKNWPNGNLFFWPVPNTAYQAELETWFAIAQLTLQGAFIMPQGYKRALVLTLAEHIYTSFPAQGQPALPIVAKMGQEARAIIQANNFVVPRLASADSGMVGKKRGGWFSYRSRTWNG